MIVEIPSCTEHEGFRIATYEISDRCPVCGGPRGETFRTLSYDGWKLTDGVNPCGHVDRYEAVRVEAALPKN